MVFVYFEKKVSKTKDQKKEKLYEYGTINIRSKSLVPFIGKKVRILVSPIDNTEKEWDAVVDIIS